MILFGLITRIYAIHNDNIFFTVDEGRDAIYARQIVNYHQIFTKGPQATLKGLYSGPLWFYFVAIGYAIFNGNPLGAPFVLIVLNLSVTILLIYVLKKEIDSKIALITGFGLMIFWPFFTTSLYGFNPFVLPALAIILILLLAKNKYGFAVIPIILAFNAELAGAIALLFFYIFIGVCQVFRRKLALRKYLFFAFGMPLLGVSKIIFDFLRTPRELVIDTGTRIGGTNFKQMFAEFGKMIGQVTIPQNVYIGFLVVIIVTIIYLRLKNKNVFAKKIVFLAFGLVFTSYLFFGSNHGWSAWHTAFIPPLVFIATLLMVWEFGKLKYFIVGSIFILQFLVFKENYINYLRPSPNPSLLYNQKKVLDYIYTHNEENGFDLYTYTDSFYDYSYQYLIGWYARSKYGFYPCEYSNFPLSHKYVYIPGADNYVEPKLGCDKFRFLIIDSDTNGNENKDWINEFRNQTVFLGKTQIGNTTIEKRKVPDKIR